MTKVKNWWSNLQPKTRKWIVAGFVIMTVISMLSPDPEATEHARAKRHVGPHVVDVRGLTLPTARKQLKAHGNYTADVKGNDGVFGVIVEENFTVCKQHKPKGHLVPLEVAKRDCD